MPMNEPFLVALLTVTKAEQRRSSHPRLQRLGEELACSSRIDKSRAGREGALPSIPAGWLLFLLVAIPEGQPSPPVSMQRKFVGQAIGEGPCSTLLFLSKLFRTWVHFGAQCPPSIPRGKA